MRRITVVPVLAATAALSMAGCGDNAVQPPERQAPTTTTTTTTTTSSAISESDCLVDRRTLQTAEDAYFAQHGRYAEEPTLVQEGFLSQESPLYDVTVSEGQVAGAGGQASGFSIQVADPACGGAGSSPY